MTQTDAPEFRIARIGPDEALQHLVAAGNGSWRQYPAYSKVAAHRSGAISQYAAVFRRGKISALANIRIKRLPIMGGGIGMIAQGPTICDPEMNNIEGFSQLICILNEGFARPQRLTLRVNCPLDLSESWRTERIVAKAPGFSAMKGTEYQTFVIDLIPDIEHLRTNLNGKWRTDLRRGERSNVKIELSEDFRDFRKLQPLLKSLAEEKGFYTPQDANFFAEVAQRTEGPERFAIHLAWNQGRLIGGHIGSYSGDTAVYLLGAVNKEGRAARASHLLQWAAISHAKQLGMLRYDLGGVDEIGNPDVFRFKKRMGGQPYSGPEMIEARAAWPTGSIIKLGEQLFRKLKG